MPNLTKTQKELYDKLEAEIRKKDHGQFANFLKEVPEGDLWAVLTAANTIEKFENINQEHTETLLAFAIAYNNYEAVEAILGAAKEKNILEEVLTTANIHVKFSDGEEHIVTPFAFAIGSNNQESIKAILHAAIKQDIY